MPITISHTMALIGLIILKPYLMTSDFHMFGKIKVTRRSHTTKSNRDSLTNILNPGKTQLMNRISYDCIADLKHAFVVRLI